MGNGNSQSTDDPASLRDYKLTYRENGHDQFGHVSVYKHLHTAECKLIKDVAFDADEIETFIDNYVSSGKFKQEFFTTASVIRSFDKKSTQTKMCADCGAFQSYSIVCDKFDKTLQSEILYRAHGQTEIDLFQESEIWYILQCILEVEDFIGTTPRRLHGNLKLNCILLTNEGKNRFTRTHKVSRSTAALSQRHELL